MNLSINAAARAELLEAAAWYEGISPALGADLLEMPGIRWEMICVGSV
jgi:hypothetical protein